MDDKAPVVCSSVWDFKRDGRVDDYVKTKLIVNSVGNLCSLAYETVKGPFDKELRFLSSCYILS